MRKKFKTRHSLTARTNALSSQLYAAVALFLAPNETEATRHRDTRCCRTYTLVIYHTPDRFTKQAHYFLSDMLQRDSYKSSKQSFRYRYYSGCWVDEPFGIIKQ